MKTRHLVSIILIVVLLVLLVRNSEGSRNGQPIVYNESLEKVAAEMNGQELTLRDLAFYVGYEEGSIEQEALAYDPDDPQRYWNLRVKGGFMGAAARKNVMQMALHDELFYQMAKDEEITLDDEEKAHVENRLSDFWEDLTERQGETGLGITKEDAKKTIEKIAYAQKYQEIYAQLHNRKYDDYASTAKQYQALLKKQKYRIHRNVWNRVSFGNVTLTHNKKKED